MHWDKFWSEGRKAIQVGCQSSDRTSLDAFGNSSMKSLDIDFSKKTHNELQYKDIPQQIIIKEDVLVAYIRMDMSYWILVHIIWEARIRQHPV